MNADQTIKVSNQFFIEKKLSRDKALQVIKEYCLEMGKLENDIDNFIVFLNTFNILIEDCLRYSLEYFQRKFNLIILKDKSNNVLKVYQNEEINNSPNESSEEHC